MQPRPGVNFVIGKLIGVADAIGRHPEEKLDLDQVAKILRECASALEELR